MTLIRNMGRGSVDNFDAPCVRMPERKKAANALCHMRTPRALRVTDIVHFRTASGTPSAHLNRENIYTPKRGRHDIEGIVSRAVGHAAARQPGRGCKCGSSDSLL